MDKAKKYWKGKKNTFTHFISLPLIENELKKKFQQLQKQIYEFFSEADRKSLEFNNPNLFHITLSMLCLQKEEHKLEAQEILKKNQELVEKILANTKLKIKLGKVTTFSKDNNKSITQYNRNNKEKQNIIYLEIIEDENMKKVMQISHLLIKEFIEKEIIDTSDLKSMKLLYDHNCGCFRAEKYHITLFRVAGSLNLEKALKEFENFEFGEVECNSIDISTRFLFDNDDFYQPLFRISF